MNTKTLSPELLQKMDAYWRAANYLSVGQIYLYDNPLLKRPLTLAHVKRMLLGHWGTTPGQNFIYTHLNRIIRQYDLDMIYMSGPGHGGPEAPVHAVLLSRRHSEPCVRGMSRVDSRGRRARLLAEPRVRGGVRQSVLDRRLRDRRRRG